MFNILATCLLIAATLSAAAIDVRTRRIPNALTGSLAVAAIVLHIPAGLGAVLLAFATLLCVFALGTIAFRFGWFGGGDVKLIAAACGMVSYPGSIGFLEDVLVAGALLALGTALVRGRLAFLLRSTVNVAMYGMTPQSPSLPYGVAIAAGSVVYSISLLFPKLRVGI